MNRFPLPLPQLLLFLGMLLTLSSCGIFSQQYNYNASRGGRAAEERPLYEEEEEAAAGREAPEDPASEAEEELVFEEEEEPDSNVPGLPTVEGEEEEEAILRLQAVAYAKNFLGTKYKLGGTRPGTGFDCSGFTSYVMREIDVDLPRTSGEQEKDGKKVRLKKVQPGDLIFYRRSPLGKVFHVSMVVDNNPDGVYVIHSTSRGVVIDNITASSYWSPKISSARSVIGD